MPKVKTAEELGEALKNGESTIEIEGDLAKKTVKIRATGKVAWAIALGAIGIAVGAAYATIPTGGTSTAVGVVAAPAAVGILGISATAAAISIAIAAGGVGGLKKLRRYKEVKRADGLLILERR